MRQTTVVFGLCLAVASVVYSAETPGFTDAQKNFWALQPVKKPAVPSVNVTGSAFLGMTFACARCHDHKYDPILQMAYGRGPAADELKTATAFREQQTAIMAKRLTGSGEKPPMPTTIVEGLDPARAAAFVDLCQMLFASNEFLYVN